MGARRALRLAVAAAALAAALAPSASGAPSRGLVVLPGAAGCLDTSGGSCGEFRAYGPKHIVVSPDGRNAYTGGNGAIQIFARDPATGALSQLEGTAGCIQGDLDEAVENGCAFDETIGRSIYRAQRLAIPPDGKHLYVQAPDRIVGFARDPRTGALTRVPGASGCAGPASACAAGPLGSFVGLLGLTISPDGLHLYVADSYVTFPLGTLTRSVTAFERSASTGALRSVPPPGGCIEQSGQAGCQASGTLFLGELAATQDHVLVGGTHGVSVLERVPALAQLGGEAGCLAPATPGCGTLEPGPAGSVAAHPNGSVVYVGLHAYVVGENGLEPRGGPETVAGFDGATGRAAASGEPAEFRLALDPAGRYAYANSPGDWSTTGGIAVFVANRSTGVLRQLAGSAGCVRWDEQAPCTRVWQLSREPSEIAVSPDGRHVYVAAETGVTAFAAPDSTPPTMGIEPGAVKLANGKASLTVKCPPAETQCTGTLSLFLGKRLLGKAGFTLGGGMTERLAIAVAKGAVTGTVQATAAAAARDLHGNAKTTKRQVTLRA